jgi:hypothetical protein
MITRQQQGRKVIPEDIGIGIGRIHIAADTLVSGTERTSRVVMRTILGDLFDLTEPRALGTMRRDKNPLPRERVPSAVRTKHDLCKRIPDRE